MERRAQYRAIDDSAGLPQGSGGHSADLDPKPLGWKPFLWPFPMGRRSPGDQILTVTFHALVDESIQQRSAVVTKGGAGVGVDLKLVFAPGVLRPRETDKRPLSVRGAKD